MGDPGNQTASTTKISLKPAVQGLTTEEAALRLKKGGFNELSYRDARSVLRIVISTVTEPMFFLLFVAAGLYLALGDPLESVIMVGSIALTVGISLYQEMKTERAIAELKQLSSPRAVVLRDRMPQRIPGREIVIDDVVLVSEGDRVPADAVLIETQGVSIDESMLTGESIAVQKVKEDRVYAGTLTVSGSGFARVTAVGDQTSLGRISESLTGITNTPTRLQLEVRSLVRWLFLAGLILCVAVTLADGWWTHRWLSASLKGITLALAMLPEEFPLILTVFTALGAWRMSKVGVLVRNLPILEALGATTVLCVDKTGTLTYNQLEVSQLWVPDQRWTKEDPDLAERFHPLLEYAVLASRKEPFDPMEKALLSCLKTRLSDDPVHLHPQWDLIKEYPLTDRLLAMSMVWNASDIDTHVVAAKGSPEAIWELCKLSADHILAARHALETMATSGLRVIGVAQTTTKGTLPQQPNDFAFSFLGLIGFEDPVRKEVPAAITECRSAGIRVMMLTGDYPQTARVIAERCGLEKANEIVGEQIETLSDTDLAGKLTGNGIVARVLPAQKLRVVKVLQQQGDVVCMTGDGVNDAPALKAADIGVAMGKRGTDVAREASDIVLIDDQFPAMVNAIAWGRRVYDNLKKASSFVLSMHVPIAGLSLIPVLLHWPSIFFPVHIVFMELIIDPVCSLMFESEPPENDVMQRPPRLADARLFTLPLLLRSLVQGSVMLIASLAVYSIAVFFFLHDAQDARTLSFVTLVVLTLILIMSDRRTHQAWWRQLGNRENPYQWPLFAVIATTLVLVIYVPQLQQIFHFHALHPADWLLVVAVCVATGTFLDLFKRLTR
jgi:Ca2+-transporting ATPase